MSPKDVLSNVTPAIFAEHHPVITDIFPHKQLPKAVKLVGGYQFEWSDYHPIAQSYLRFFGQATDMAARWIVQPRQGWVAAGPLALAKGTSRVRHAGAVLCLFLHAQLQAFVGGATFFIGPVCADRGLIVAQRCLGVAF